MGKSEENPGAWTVVVDKREQLAYTFPVPTTCATLKTGDYSILGYEDQVSIERKSKADAYATIGAHRARFEREFVRLSEMDYGAVVVESTLQDFVNHPPSRSALHPRAALHTLVGWSVKYGVHVSFPGSRLMAETLVYHLLRHWRKYRQLPAQPSGGAKEQCLLPPTLNDKTQESTEFQPRSRRTRAGSAMS